MNQLINIWEYITIYIEVALHKIFRDDGRRHDGDFPTVKEF